MARKLSIPPPIDRFMSFVSVADTGCWEWTGYVNPTTGYGQFTWAHNSRRTWTAHTAGYLLLVGQAPEGLQLDHTCRNRSCVNPAHLEPVTQRVNILRGESPSAIHARKTHCPAGHSLVGAYVYPSGSRACRVCHSQKERERQRRARAS